MDCIWVLGDLLERQSLACQSLEQVLHRQVVIAVAQDQGSEDWSLQRGCSIEQQVEPLVDDEAAYLRVLVSENEHQAGHQLEIALVVHGALEEDVVAQRPRRHHWDQRRD